MHEPKAPTVVYGCKNDANSIMKKEKPESVNNQKIKLLNYYLMCNNLKWGNITNYRVDRMAEVRAEEESIIAQV